MSERDGIQGAWRTTTETYHVDRQGSENAASAQANVSEANVKQSGRSQHQATQQTACADSYSAPPKPFRVRLFGLLLLALALGLAAAFAMLAYGYGKQLMQAEGDQAREQAVQLRQEVDRLNGVLTAAESMRNIESAEKQQMTEQIKVLESENNRLKEDLSFYERLFPAKTKAGGVAIRRFAAELVPPNQLRYRLLILSQDSREKQGFTGQAQIIVTAMQGEHKLVIVFPQPDSPEEQHFKLRFRHYQRLEGILNLPEGLTVKSVQARVLENGQTKAQHAVRL